MVDIIKAYSGQGQEDSPHCGNSDERKSLKFYCADCNHFLCEERAGAHRKIKTVSGHQVKEIGKFKPSEARDYARRANVCKKHNDEVRFYCEQCVICICRDCAILDHRDHNIISLDNGLQKKKSEIEKKMKQVQENVPRLRNEKESLENRRTKINKSIEQATEELHKTAEHNIQLIRQHQASVTERLMKLKETLDTAFSNTMTGLDEKLVKVKSSLDFGNEILQRNNLPEILNVEEVLEHRFQELMEPCAFDLKVNYSAVKYVANDLSSLKDSPGKLVTSNTEPSLTMTDGMGLAEGVKGEDCTFTVITKDSQGNKTYSEIDGVEVCIQSLQTRKSVKVTITDSHDGCYRVSYKPEATGQFNVLITVAGEAIKGNPFQLRVKERNGKKKAQLPTFLGKPLQGDFVCRGCLKVDFYACSLLCGHFYCNLCRNQLKVCLVCGEDAIFTGNQPAGHMTHGTDGNHSLPGHEDCGTIVIGFNFDRGIQGPKHPNPGVPYWCLFCNAYLPDNAEGQKLCSLLRKAFDGRLLFTIGEDNTVISNGIELKTSKIGGPSSFGYPDPGYLDRLKSQLAEKRITQPGEAARP